MIDIIIIDSQILTIIINLLIGKIYKISNKVNYVKL